MSDSYTAHLDCDTCADWRAAAVAHIRRAGRHEPWEQWGQRIEAELWAAALRHPWARAQRDSRPGEI